MGWCWLARVVCKGPAAAFVSIGSVAGARGLFVYFVTGVDSSRNACFTESDRVVVVGSGGCPPSRLSGLVVVVRFRPIYCSSR